jgi:hypothetical protein
MSKTMIVRAASITVALALMGGATFAAFSSANSNTGNSFGSGTMALKINTQSPTSTGMFHVTNAKPTDTSTQLLDFTLGGTVNAADVLLTNIGVTAGSPNLGDKLMLELWNDIDTPGVVGGADTLIYGPHALTDSFWTNKSLGWGLTAGLGNKPVLAKITFADADNTYQGTSVSFDLNFVANQ